MTPFGVDQPWCGSLLVYTICVDHTFTLHVLLHNGSRFAACTLMAHHGCYGPRIDSGTVSNIHIIIHHTVSNRVSRDTVLGTGTVSFIDTGGSPQ